MKNILYLLIVTIALSIGFLSCQSNLAVPDPQEESALKGARTGGKVAIIHNGKVILVSQNAVDSHLGHGDALAADFKTFNIRNNNSVPLPNRIMAPWDSDIKLSENQEGDGFSFLTPQPGQKVGYGTNTFDGTPINQIESANWNPVSVFLNPGKLPYLNIWVTDGTNYAIIASEFTAADGNYLNTDFGIRQVWKVFEYSGTNLSWLFTSGVGTRDNSQFLLKDGVKVTFDDFANNIIIGSPSGLYPSYVGSGAPRGGYGFNLVYGDTFSNFADGPQTFPNQLNDLTVKANGRAYEAINF